MYLLPLIQLHCLEEYQKRILKHEIEQKGKVGITNEKKILSNTKIFR